MPQTAAADRHPESGAVIAATLALLILTDSIQVWQIWALAFILGLDTVIDNPARQVFVNEIVGPRNLSNAISLNSSDSHAEGPPQHGTTRRGPALRSQETIDPVHASTVGS
ncbi:MAG TPA: MFS transporter [Microbacteriaceae bacterium]